MSFREEITYFYAEFQVSQEQSATSNKWQTFLDQPEDNNGENEVDDEEYTTSRQQFNQTKKDITKAARQRYAAVFIYNRRVAH